MCSSLSVLLPHCAPFPMTTVGCCWVPVNFPCGVVVHCRPSLSPPLELQWEILPAPVESWMHFRQVQGRVSSRKKFCSGSIVWCGSASAPPLCIFYIAKGKSKSCNYEKKSCNCIYSFISMCLSICRRFYLCSNNFYRKFDFFSFFKDIFVRT
jgi:hypothetical protein